MITKKFGQDFFSGGGALTLPASAVDSNKSDTTGEHETTHPSGWTIKGVVHEDYYYWVNDFEAHHSAFGKVWGNFENEVYADSEEGFAHFWANHEPDAWDYRDI